MSDRDPPPFPTDSKPQPSPTGVPRGVLDRFKESPAPQEAPRGACPGSPGKDSKGRWRLWQISERFHCMIVGTCFGMAELRHLAEEFGLGAMDGLPDYGVHSRLVAAAGRRGPLAKRMHTLLERRYRTTIRRYSVLTGPDQVLEQWQADFEAGRIAPALWALVTHPAATERICREAYGQLHMLGHQIGAGERADLQRLALLERERDRLKERLREAQSRIAELRTEREQALSQLSEWQTRARVSEHREQETRQRLEAWEKGESTQRLLRRLRKLEGRLEHERARARHAEQGGGPMTARADEASQAQETKAEDRAGSRAAEPSAFPNKALGEGGQSKTPIRQLLVVGGRGGLVAHYRDLVEGTRARFLYHDGGIEDSRQRLGRLLARADAVICPTDCVSHTAFHQVKRFCKGRGLPHQFPKTSGVTGLRYALQRLS